MPATKCSPSSAAACAASESRWVPAIAEPATAKAAAVGVPRVQWLVQTRVRGGPAPRAAGPGESSTPKSRVLVLAPTRGLAVQVGDEIHGLAYHTSVTSAAVYGG